MTFDKIHQMAEDLLDAAASALTPAGPDDPRRGPPPAQYVTHGDPAIDGEQLTVHVSQIRPAGALGQRGQGAPSGGGVVPMASFVVSLYRCSPTGSGGDVAPTQQQMDDEAKGLMVDAYALLTELMRKWATNQLFTTYTIDRSAINWATGLVAKTPSGAYSGYTMQLDVEIP